MPYKELHINNDVIYNTYYADINSPQYDKIKCFVQKAKDNREHNLTARVTGVNNSNEFESYMRKRRYSSFNDEPLNLFIVHDYIHSYVELYTQLALEDIKHLYLPRLSQGYEYVSMPKNVIEIVQKHSTLSFDKKVTSLFSEYQKLYNYLDSLYLSIEQEFAKHKCKYLLDPYILGLKKFKQFLFTPRCELKLSSHDKGFLSSYVSKNVPNDLSWDIISVLSKHFFGDFIKVCNEYIYNHFFKRNSREKMEVIYAFTSLVGYYTTAFDQLINESLKYNAITIHLEHTNNKTPKNIIEFKATFSNTYEKETNEDFMGIPLYVRVFRVNVHPDYKKESLKAYKESFKNFLYETFRNYDELTLTHSDDLEKFILTHTRNAIKEQGEMELSRLNHKLHLKNTNSQ